MNWVAALGISWLVIGAGTAVMLARRGHEPALWGVIGLILGPFAPIAALAAVREEAQTAPRVLRRGHPLAGPVDVLAGIDGSPEAAAAVHAALALHRGRLGRLALAVVIPFDADDDSELEAAATTAARSLSGLDPATVVLRGEPADALARHAGAEGYELLVVGPRGKGRSSSPLGSVALRLASGAPVPVLIGPVERR